MDALFLPLADLVGASVDQIKLIFCLLVAYPLGSLYTRVPSSQPALRHLFSVTVAVFFFFPVLRIYTAFFQLLGSILATYLIAKHDKSQKMPWVVFAVVMGHLTYNHVIRAIYGFSYETMEVTGPQMVLTMKLTTFAWNVYDGRRKEEELDKWQKAKRITQYPSLLEFLGYSFYFPGILVGPYLDFAEYMDLVNETPFQDPAVKPKIKPGRRLPSYRKRAAYWRLVKGLAFLGIFVVLGPKFYYARGATPEFAQLSLLRRILLFQTFGPVERAKYYAIWTLTEGASILTGLGFTGFGPHGEAQWTGAANVKVSTIEFPQNFKVLLDAWNMKTNVWLRECVYKRVTPRGQKPGHLSSMITFFTSAFWHGIASGYYITFLLGGFVTSVARLVRANIRPFFLPAEGQPPSLWKKAYDVVGIITSAVVLNFAASPFLILSARVSWAAWANLAFYGHFLIFGGMLFFYLGGAGLCRRWHKKLGIVVPARGAPRAPAKEANGNGSAVSSGVSTPASEMNFVLPPPVDKLVPPPQK